MDNQKFTTRNIVSMDNQKFTTRNIVSNDETIQRITRYISNDTSSKYLLLNDVVVINPFNTYGHSYKFYIDLYEYEKDVCRIHAGIEINEHDMTMEIIRYIELAKTKTFQTPKQYMAVNSDTYFIETGDKPIVSASIKTRWSS